MIEITSKKEGAELTSIKFNGKEKLHDGVSDWKRHAPVLFPIVGQLKNGEAIIDGKTCKMSQHGFARDSIFEKIGENSYVLKYNEETLKKFPYKFELYISYETTEDSVITKYRVKNVDNKTIYFGLGGHPAFKCDYQKGELRFSKPENGVKIYQLENGLLKLTPENTDDFIDKNVIKLNQDIFDKDAIIMKDLKSNKLSLYEKGKEILEFEFSDFPYLAIWSRPGAKFLCIEPWFNTTDKIDSKGKFEEKENICTLDKGEEFECSYKVKFI